MAGGWAVTAADAIRWSGGGLCAPRAAGVTARLLCCEDPPHPILFFSLVSHFPSLPFSSSPANQARRTEPVQGRLSVLSESRTKFVCNLLVASFHLRPRLNRFYFHFPGCLGLLGRLRTAGRPPPARDSRVVWTHSSHFPPALGSSVCGGLCCSASLPLLSFRKAPDPMEGETASSSRRVSQHALGAHFAQSFGRLQQAKQTPEWSLGSARRDSSAYASSVGAVPEIPT